MQEDSKGGVHVKGLTYHIVNRCVLSYYMSLQVRDFHHFQDLHFATRMGLCVSEECGCYVSALIFNYEFFQSNMLTTVKRLCSYCALIFHAN